jgi:diaminohydroxyphosphoribosylaminopyrimidine deaminase/5-amino-6-(5-phosphoribosylamino)uracil reductase
MSPDYMREALDLARQGVALTSPNPMVGCVIVRDGMPVGRGFHTWAGLKHAEILALDKAGDLARSNPARIRAVPVPARTL